MSASTKRSHSSHVDKDDIKRIAEETLAKKFRDDHDRKSRVVSEDELRYAGIFSIVEVCLFQAQRAQVQGSAGGGECEGRYHGQL